MCRERAACQRRDATCSITSQHRPPFLEAGSRVLAPIREWPADCAPPLRQSDTYDTYPGPAAGFAEQVYCYDLLADGAARRRPFALQRAGRLGASPALARRNCPAHRLAQTPRRWRTGYVTGPGEPATNFPNLKTFFERQQSPRCASCRPGHAASSPPSIEVLRFGWRRFRKCWRNRPPSRRGPPHHPPVYPPPRSPRLTAQPGASAGQPTRRLPFHLTVAVRAIAVSASADRPCSRFAVRARQRLAVLNGHEGRRTNPFAGQGSGSRDSPLDHRGDASFSRAFFPFQARYL